MSISAVLAFWGVSILFVITPGADWAYAIGAGLRHRSVVPAVAGMLAGHLVATLAVAAGLAALMARSPTLITVLTTVGALYLMWLGQGMLRSQPTPMDQNGPSLDVPTTGPKSPVGAAPAATLAGVHVARSSGHTSMTSSASPWRESWTGFGVSGLNPKVFLLFLALLPQFTDPAFVWPVAAQSVVLGLVHVASCAVVYLAVGLGAKVVLRARPSVANLVTRCSGAALVVVGVVLLVEPHLH